MDGTTINREILGLKYYIGICLNKHWNGHKVLTINVTWYACVGLCMVCVGDTHIGLSLPFSERHPMQPNSCVLIPTCIIKKHDTYVKKSIYITHQLTAFNILITDEVQPQKTLLHYLCC